MKMSRFRYTHFLGFALLASAWPHIASADVLPWLSDPWRTEKKIARYSEKLKPQSCPLPGDVKIPLKLNSVVILALCHNPGSKSAYLGLLAQAYSYGESHASYLPEVTATYDLSRTKTFGKSGNTDTRSKGTGISAGLLLYDFGQREASLDVAEQTLIASGFSYDSTMQGIIATALEGYYNLLTAQNAVKVAQEGEQYAHASLEAAELKHELGQVALADRLQAKGAYSQAMLGVQQADNQLAQEKASLARLLGLPADTPLEVEEIDNHSLMLEPFGDQVQSLMEKAKHNRSDLASQRAQIKGSEASLRALKRSQLATLSANVDVGMDDADIFNTSTDRSQAIGVSVSIPIFTGFSHTYNRRAAERTLQAEKIELLDAELGVEQDVWGAWHNYQTAQQSWHTSLDQLDTAIQLKDVALGRYKEGLGTILDVLNAQQQFTSALQSQLQARYNLLTTRVDLVRAVGVLNLDTMEPKVEGPPPPPPAPLH